MLNLLGSFEKLSLNPSSSPVCAWRVSSSGQRSTSASPGQAAWTAPGVSFQGKGEESAAGSEEFALSLPQNASDNVTVPGRLPHAHHHPGAALFGVLQGTHAIQQPPRLLFSIISRALLNALQQWDSFHTGALRRGAGGKSKAPRSSTSPML